MQCTLSSNISCLAWVRILIQLKSRCYPIIPVFHRQGDLSMCAISRMDVKLASHLPALVVDINDLMPGVCLMCRVVGLGSSDPEFKSPSFVELIPGGVDSACHPSVVTMSASSLVSCVGVTTRPRLCPTDKETALAAPLLCTEFCPDGWFNDPTVSFTKSRRAIDVILDKFQIPARTSRGHASAVGSSLLIMNQ